MAVVLVVEDDPWSQEIVRELLERRGHQVVTACDVEDARARLGGAPDIVLLDIHIPGGGGELLLREIRASATGNVLPVVALTASAMSGDRERFLRQGFTGYMSKPIDARLFGEHVESYL